jgi:hypothetical protein
MGLACRVMVAWRRDIGLSTLQATGATANLRYQLLQTFEHPQTSPIARELEGQNHLTFSGIHEAGRLTFAPVLSLADEYPLRNMCVDVALPPCGLSYNSGTSACSETAAASTPRPHHPGALSGAPSRCFRPTALRLRRSDHGSHKRPDRGYFAFGQVTSTDTVTVDGSADGALGLSIPMTWHS